MPRRQNETKQQKLQRQADKMVRDADFILVRYGFNKAYYIQDPQMPPEAIDNILEEIYNQ